MTLFLPETGYMQHIINKNFPDAIARRFMVRMDSQVFNDKEDESVFMRKKYRKEHLHVYFDLLELLDIPPHVPAKYFEVFLFKSFRDAIKDGTISIEKELEWSDNKTARANKRAKDKTKKKDIEESFKFARDNNFDVKRIEAKLPKLGGKKGTDVISKYELKGGE